MVPHRRGMTAVEVLASTTLASLLFVALAGVLASLARQEKVLRARDTIEAWEPQLAAQLE